MKPTAIILAACAALAAATAPAAERVEAWGRGVSEFEAVKSAYKQMLAEALKLSMGRAASMEGSLRRTFVREVEEDLLRVQSTYFPGAPAPRCQEERESFECHVVAQAQMDEIEGRVRSLLAGTGGDFAIRDLRIGLVSKEVDTEARDLVAYLRDDLESDFGHDVLVSDDYVDIGALRDGCREYDRRARDAEARGDSHLKTAQAYRRSHSACRDLASRDLIIVIDDIESRYGPFTSRTAGMRAELTLRMQLHMTGDTRSMPAPRPHIISQVGHGEDAGFARSDVRNRLYASTANYVSQQMNEVLANASTDGRLKLAAPVERQYKVLVSGANPDTPEGRAQLRLVTDWFAGPGGFPLEADFGSGNFGERVYGFRSARSPAWDTMIDQLHGVLDQAKAHARIDVDRSRNLTIAFQPNDSLKPKHSVAVVVEAKRAKRRIGVEHQSMEVRRRDPESGAAIAVNEAVLRIRNKTAKDLLIVVTPVWSGQDGSSLPAPYSYRQTVRIPAKSSERFNFMAPSSFAGPVSIELSCPEKACEMPR